MTRSTSIPAEGVSATKTPPLTLQCETAEDLMKRDPITIPSDYTIKEAAAFLKDGGLRERMTRARLQARDQQRHGRGKV